MTGSPQTKEGNVFGRDENGDSKENDLDLLIREDYDGFVARINSEDPTEGGDEGDNTIRIDTNGNDFITGICSQHGNDFDVEGEHMKAFIVGYTTGDIKDTTINGDNYYSAFIIQFDITTMKIGWKRQVMTSPTNSNRADVLGYACAVMSRPTLLIGQSEDRAEQTPAMTRRSSAPILQSEPSKSHRRIPN